MESIYRQYVKVGGTWSASRYFDVAKRYSSMYAAPNRNPTFRPEYLCYDQIVELYERLLSPKKVYVYLYEEFRQNPTDFLQRYCEDLGLDLTVELDQLNSSGENISYGPLALSIIRNLNRFTLETLPNKHYFFHVPGWYYLVKYFSTRLSKLPSCRGQVRQGNTSFRLPAYVSEKHQATYADSNRRLVQQRSLPLATYDYPV